MSYGAETKRGVDKQRIVPVKPDGLAKRCCDTLRFGNGEAGNGGFYSYIVEGIEVSNVDQSAFSRWRNVVGNDIWRAGDIGGTGERPGRSEQQHQGDTSFAQSSQLIKALQA